MAAEILRMDRYAHVAFDENIITVNWSNLAARPIIIQHFSVVFSIWILLIIMCTGVGDIDVICENMAVFFIGEVDNDSF